MKNIAKAYARKQPIIATMDSRKTLGDPDNNYFIARLSLTAEDTGDGWVLVAALETETFEIDGEGEDNGEFESSGEVYRIPFPDDKSLRKNIIQLIQSNPRFDKATTPFLLTQAFTR